MTPVTDDTSWHSYPSVFALGHKAVAELFLDPVVVQEKIDGCVTPDTMILGADLIYRQAGDLAVGDRLVAFTDTTTAPVLEPAVVTACAPILKDCVEIITSSRKVIASADHPWLVKGKSNNHKVWLRSERLVAGRKIISLPLWIEDTSWAGGYLAGFYDGEGTVVRGGIGRRTRYVGAYQSAGYVADLVKRLLAEAGFRFSIDTRQRDEKWHRAETIVIRGGWTEAMRFLGTVRPRRLLLKAEEWWSGAGMNSLPREEIVSVRRVGRREVVGLSTSTGTYVAAGMLCHNSQFSMGRFAGELHCRSKGAQLVVGAPEKMFQRAVETAASLDLRDGWTYRCEYLQKPKHNALAYDRVPEKHLIVFDVNPGHEQYLGPLALAAEARRIGLESVPLLLEGRIGSMEDITGFLETLSILGAQKVEGIVVKNYARFGLDKKVLMGKYVSEAYKEVHAREWKIGNPKAGDVVAQLIDRYRTPARWQKAIQHLRERNAIEGSPHDIAALIREVPEDVERECADEIREALWAWAWPKIRRGLNAGMPEWYKHRLLEEQPFVPVEDPR